MPLPCSNASYLWRFQAMHGVTSWDAWTGGNISTGYCERSYSSVHPSQTQRKESRYGKIRQRKPLSEVSAFHTCVRFDSMSHGGVPRRLPPPTYCIPFQLQNLHGINIGDPTTLALANAPAVGKIGHQDSATFKFPTSTK